MRAENGKKKACHLKTIVDVYDFLAAERNDNKEKEKSTRHPQK